MKYLTRSEINTEKWDTCVAHSVKPLIYGVSWFLDAATNQQWDGLVWGDYEAVMPLPWNKKLIKKQLYTPYTTQQLGVFSTPSFDYTVQNLESIFKKFVQVNYNSRVSISLDLPLKQKRNSVVFLEKDYEKNYANYSRNRKRDLKKGEEVEIKPISANEFMDVYGSEEKSYLKDLSEMERVFSACEKHKCFIGYGAKLAGQSLSLVAGFKKFNRLHLLSVHHTEDGHKHAAYPKLVDFLVKRYATNESELDFMGSMVDEIHDFNRRFGAKEEIYYSYERANPILSTVKKAIGR